MYVVGVVESFDLEKVKLKTESGRKVYVPTYTVEKKDLEEGKKIKAKLNVTFKSFKVVSHAAVAPKKKSRSPASLKKHK